MSRVPGVSGRIIPNCPRYRSPKQQCSSRSSYLLGGVDLQDRTEGGGGGGLEQREAALDVAHVHGQEPLGGGWVAVRRDVGRVLVEDLPEVQAEAALAVEGRGRPSGHF